MSAEPILLEQIERDIIQNSRFGVQLVGLVDSVRVECDMAARGSLAVYVQRRHKQWIMTDACYTVRTVGWLWNEHPRDIAEICASNGVQDNLGELWLHVDSDGVNESMCFLLCAMIEIVNRGQQYRPGGKK